MVGKIKQFRNLKTDLQVMQLKFRDEMLVAVTLSLLDQKIESI